MQSFSDKISIKSTLVSTICCLALLGLAASHVGAATFNIPNDDVAALKTAIITANSNDQADTINLAAGGTYILNAVDNTTQGPNGLPVITDDVVGPDLTVNGKGATIQRSVAEGTPELRILCNGGATVTLIRLTISQGKPVTNGAFPINSGGGIFNYHGVLTAQNCTFSNNTAGFGADTTGAGGAICNHGSQGDVNLTLTGCTFSNNTAEYGGALYNDGSGANSDAILSLTDCSLIDNTAYYGGVLFNDGNYSGSATLTLANCTLSSNDALDSGGGVYNNGYQGNAGATLTNCTLSSNYAGYGGGGIYNDGASGSVTLSLTSCTVTDNIANVGGGIFNYGPDGTAVLQLGNTILKSGSSGGNVFNSSSSVGSYGYNLSDDAAGGDAGTGPGGYLNNTGDRRNTDPKLGALANNGGPTKTHALLPGSPAINTANNTTAPATDQRDYGRNGSSDIGAFEYNGVPPLAYRVDALIKQSSEASTAYALNDVYQLTPSGAQVEKQNVSSGNPAIYQVKVQNDTNATRSFGVKAVESSGTAWTIVYRRGTTDIGTAIRSTAGYTTAVLAPGQIEIITVRMTPAAGAGASKSTTLKVLMGGADKVTRDAVKATTTTTASTASS